MEFIKFDAKDQNTWPEYPNKYCAILLYSFY